MHLDEIMLMTSIAVFLLLAAVCSIIFNKIKMPSLIGYLVTGIIVANIWNVSEESDAVVEILSNMGLILLMFCIGMEINLKKIRKQGIFAMRVALVEIPFMVLGGTIVGGLLGLDSIQSICLGAVIAGSSTAVVLGVLKMQNRLDKDRIDTLILVIIMEDIAQVVILSMITPMMAGSELDAGGLAALIMSILAFMVVSIVVGLRFMPRIINWVSDNVTSEILVIFAVGLAFGMALLASYVGLSVAIGAFLMGMMIAPSRRNKEILHDIEPMKSIFMAMFFISVGMEIGLGTLVDNLGLTLIFLIMFIVLKTLAVFSGYWLANETSRESFASAISFVAMGEFAFIIAKQALDYNVFSEDIYTSIVGAALLSMITLPILSKDAAERWDKTVSKMPGALLRTFKAIDNVKVTFYERIALSSRKTRKEVSGSMTRAYLSMIGMVAVELIFILITPPLREWGIAYFGGDEWLWSFLLLILNMVVLYIPTFRLVDTVKDIMILADIQTNRQRSRREYSILDRFLISNTWLIALMIAIVILIVVPNGLSIWEHIVVLVVALLILLYVNRRTVTKRTDLIPFEEDGPDYMDEDSFRKLLDSKYAKKIEEESQSQKSVAIDSGDKRY